MKLPVRSLLSIWLLVGTAAETAVAQNPSAVAVELAYDGKTRFERGDYMGAINKFHAAQQIVASPVFDLYLARSKKALGRWTEALEDYDLVMAFPADPTNPAWLEAQTAATKERRTLLAEMPRLEVSVVGVPSGVRLHLRLDGRELPWPLQRIAVNPGSHSLSVSAEARLETRVFTAEAGKIDSLRFDFTPQPEKDGPGAAPRNPYRTPAIVLLGLSGASTIATVVTGILAIAGANDLHAWCDAPENDCANGEPEDPDRQEQLREVQTLAGIATGTTIAAGVTGAMGLTLLVLGRPKSDEPAKIEARGASVWFKANF